jgi:dTDP-4-dehydrorhamnose 3,5-epimerase
LKFTSTAIEGAYVIDLEPSTDERGFFARTFCRDEFARLGLEGDFAQCNVSFNARKGTIRGLHFQASPHEETKVVSCPHGAIFDVIVDLRADSATFGCWAGFELSRHNRRAIYIPRGIAHGFQSLEDDTDVFYLMGQSYHPESARGVRWNDPRLRIPWPVSEVIVSDRDRQLPGMPE